MALTPCNSKTNLQGMELTRHGTGLFPIACYHDDLCRETVPWHWHPELEVGIITRGAAVIAAGAERFTAKQGDGFFVNSGVLHTVLDHERSGCRLHSSVFHPRLVGGSVDSIFWQNYIQPLIADGTRQSLHLDGSAPWHTEALRAIASAWKSCVEEEPGYEFQARSALSQFVFLLSQHCPSAARPLPGKVLRDEERVKQMLRFIQEHYSSDITVADIAGSATISESECLRCFRSIIGAAPVQYLKQFRVQRAAELLRSSREGVAEIGGLCGFQDASYFSKTFRELKGCTPTEYRRAGGQPV